MDTFVNSPGFVVLIIASVCVLLFVTMRDRGAEHKEHVVLRGFAAALASLGWIVIGVAGIGGYVAYYEAGFPGLVVISGCVLIVAIGVGVVAFGQLLMVFAQIEVNTRQREQAIRIKNDD